MKGSYILVAILFASVVFGQNAKTILECQSLLSGLWNDLDNGYYQCSSQNLTLIGCANNFQSILSKYAFSDMRAFYPDFAGPNIVHGVANVSLAFARVYDGVIPNILGSGNEHHVFGLPVITFGGGNDPDSINFTTSGSSWALNRFGQQTFLFLDRKIHSFERRQGNWKLAAFEGSVRANVALEENFVWSLPRF